MRENWDMWEESNIGKAGICGKEVGMSVWGWGYVGRLGYVYVL